jgi:uncharacterized Fe-S cluster-containing MiaB family protein
MEKEEEKKKGNFEKKKKKKKKKMREEGGGSVSAVCSANGTSTEHATQCVLCAMYSDSGISSLL